MSSKILCVRDVWKRFSLRGLSLRTLLRSWMLRGRERAEPFWALREISFEIGEGEAFGIIGANGAGKSTLLKLLAGVMPATRGTIDVCERVAPLIEVGAGFHPELSGRENIYLNGAIMGLTRSEIKQRFDSIVHFSGLEPFLDLAVKHYSSGMYMRLGFSVAVHLEPQLLLVDEVLAVGDRAFQHASLERIRAMQSQGTAVVLVSHNLFAITGVCSNAMLLEHGKAVAIGHAVDVVRTYEGRVNTRELQTPATASADASHGPARLLEVRFSQASTDGIGVVRCGDDARVRVRVSSTERLSAPSWSVGITRMDGIPAAASNSVVEGTAMPDLEGEQVLELELPHLRLVPGTYRLSVAVGNRDLTHEWDRHEIYFDVTSDLPNIDSTFYGSFILDHRWRVIEGIGRQESGTQDGGA